MHYLVIENEQQEELTYAIAGFFWDNGHEISIQKTYTLTDSNYLRADCVISLADSRFTTKNLRDTKFFMQFCTDGVYSNAIPFPHKLFAFKRLDSAALRAFFSWCNKLNLFKR